MLVQPCYLVTVPLQLIASNVLSKYFILIIMI